MTRSIVVERLDVEAAEAALADLCDVLMACVEGGASVGFMQPYSRSDAEDYWMKVLADVRAGLVFLLAAQEKGKTVGTVQVAPAAMPNQPHRGDLRKLLVHPQARGLGLARQLMDAAEAEAVANGLSLLVLDTATGSNAEEIYVRLGWQRAGIIPDYAMWPEGGYCDTTIFYKKINTYR